MIVALSLATMGIAVAQPSAVDHSIQKRRIRSDTIGTPGSAPAAGPATQPLVPHFTGHPSDVSTTAFVDASFTVAFNGRPLPAVSWQFSADGTNWNDVPGATTSSLLVRSPVVAHDGTRWRARLDAPGMAPVFSNPATLSVAPATPTITLDGLAQKFDGTPRTVNVTTVPAGLRVTLRYLRNGTPVATPVEPGAYAVHVDAVGPNHYGSILETLIVE